MTLLKRFNKLKLPAVEMNPVRILALGFAVVIFLGGVILSLPIATQSGEPTPFLDSLFISTSAVCVTGLVTVDTATHWNYFGKTVIITLIQIGGLGFMSFATMAAVFLGKKLGLKDRLLMQEAYNAMSLQGIIRMVRYVVFFTFGVELAGALILMTQFIPMFGWGRGIYYGVFHSISAFCNAGFDLMGNYTSLTGVNTNKIILFTIASLIVIAGLGFSVWIEIWNFKSFTRLSLHAKLVLSTTAALVFGGAILIFIFEYHNPVTLGTMGILDKMNNALFASVTPRTAGFNSISVPDMAMASRLLTIILMFIGGSPGSTAGGIKTTAISVLFLTVLCVIRGRHDPEAFGRRIDKENVFKAFAVVVIGLGIVVGVSLWMSFFEAPQGATMEQLIFEATSAFATVGLTEGITPGLQSGSKIALLMGMYFGRVGPITVMLALSKQKSPAQIRYPDGKILIG